MMSSSAPKPKKCAFLGRSCIQHQCQHYVQLLGANPQTGEPVDRWDCTFNAHTVLLMDNARAIRALDAELSQYREEQNKRAETTAQAINKSSEAMKAITDVFGVLSSAISDKRALTDATQK